MLQGGQKIMFWHTRSRQIALASNGPVFRNRKQKATSVAGGRSVSSRGFSLIELVVVVSIIMMVAAVSVINLPPALAAMRMNSALNITAETLRLARGSAFSDRCVYRVDFTLPQTLTVTQQVTGVVVKTLILPVGVNFDAEPGLPSTPTTTPDGFGSGAISGPIDFGADFGVGGLTQVFFYPDGSARDANGHINNGIVYLAAPGNLSSSKAVTLWGLTGRVKKWTLSISPTTGVKSWGQS
jgi:prepilin-type N-terminal cleavage/methylation domain-containing protein